MSFYFNGLKNPVMPENIGILAIVQQNDKMHTPLSNVKRFAGLGVCIL
jgi:hypothetical protein